MGVAVLVVSCDRYADLWDPFFRCFFKYWPNCPYPVYLGVNNLKYTNERVRLLNIGNDGGYCENLKKMLDLIEETWIIFWVEDRLVAGPVDTARVARLVAAAQERRAAYMKLIPEHPMVYVAAGEEWGIVPKGTPYRVSMTIALWRRDLLIRILRSDENAWDLERKGSERSNDIEEPFLALSSATKRSPPIPHVHLIIKGRVLRSAVAFIKAEGLEAALSQRLLESLRSAAYVWLYHLFFGVVRPLQFRLSCLRGKGQTYTTSS